MTRKESMSHRYQLKKKVNNVTNARRVKCEMKKICESHVVLPSLVSDCPQCQQIIKKLNKEGPDGTFIQDKLKPFIHNYAKLFCNETILKAIMRKHFPNGKEVLKDRGNEKTKCMFSKSKCRWLKLKNKYDNDITNSIWSIVETDVSSVRFKNKEGCNRKCRDKLDKIDKKRIPRSPSNEHKTRAAPYKHKKCRDEQEKFDENLIPRSPATEHKTGAVPYKHKKCRDEQEKFDENLIPRSPSNEHKTGAAPNKHKKLSASNDKTKLTSEERETNSKPKRNEESDSSWCNCDQRSLCSCPNQSPRRQETIPDLVLKEQSLASTSEDTNTSMVKLWPKSRERLNSSKEDYSLQKSRNSNFKNELNREEPHFAGKSEVVILSCGADDVAEMSRLDNHRQRNVSPNKNFKAKKDNFENNHFRPDEGQGLHLKILDASFKKPPAFVAKYVGKNMNSDIQSNIRRTNMIQSPNENCYKPLQHNNRQNSRMNDQHINCKERKDYIPVSAGLCWKRYQYPDRPPPYQPDSNEHSYLFPDRTYYPKHLRYFPSSDTYVPRRDTWRSSYKTTISPLLNPQDRSFLNQMDLNNIGYSPMYRRKFLDTSLNNNARPPQWNYTDTYKRNIPATRKPILMSSSLTDEKEIIRPNILGRNLPTAECSVAINSETSRYKLKTPKFKSVVKPYNIESRRLLKVGSNQGKSSNRSSDIGPILQKYVGSKIMDNYYGQKETEQIERSFVDRCQKINDLIGSARKGENKRNNTNIPQSSFCSMSAKLKDNNLYYQQKGLPINSKETQNNPNPKKKITYRRDQKFPSPLRSSEKNTAKDQGQEISNSNVESGINSRSQAAVNDKVDAEQNGRHDKTWNKYLEVINAHKVDHFKVERVQQPLEPLLSKIIHPGTISNVRVPRVKAWYNNTRGMNDDTVNRINDNNSNK